MRAPKNKTSVARKAHMPSVAASLCCASVAYWKPARASAMVRLRLRPPFLVVAIGGPDNDRDRLEILGRRRRASQPFEPGRIPGIGGGAASLEQGPAEIEDWKRIADRE